MRFQPEVDLNPDIGCMWMPRGEQVEVAIPRDNFKRYLCGSMSWRSGEQVVTQGTRRNAELFVATWTTCGGRSVVTAVST